MAREERKTHEKEIPDLAERFLDIKLLRPGLDNTRLFISLTAGAGTRCMSLLPSSPSLLRTHASGPSLPNIPFPFMPGGYIPRLEIKERECWKFI